MKISVTACLSAILIFFFISNNFAQQYWGKLNSPVQTNYNKCFFIDDNTGWISGDSGIIIKTTNSGNTFSIYNTGLMSNIESFQFVNESTGWAVSMSYETDSIFFPGTVILKTTNGGINWSGKMFPDTNIYLPVIYFFDPMNGYMCGIASSIYYTSDEGGTWTKAETDSITGFTFPVKAIKFFDHSTGYACGGYFDFAGVVWKSTNGGRNWNRDVIGSEPLNDIYITNSAETVMTGGDFEFGVSLAKTLNTGSNWDYSYLGYFGVGESIDFRTPYECWISLGFSGKFLYSLDSGNTWTDIYTPDTNRINDIQFVDSLHGWAAGNNGMILKYIPLKSSVLSNEETSVTANLSLYQNYPNPFNPRTIINYLLLKPDYISLKIYDVLGKEIIQLINGKQLPGNYKVEFDADNIPSGIYYYQLSTENYSITKKMTVLK